MHVVVVGARCRHAGQRIRAGVPGRVAEEAADHAVVERTGAAAVVAEGGRLRERRGRAVVDAAVDQKPVCGSTPHPQVDRLRVAPQPVARRRLRCHARTLEAGLRRGGGHARLRSRAGAWLDSGAGAAGAGGGGNPRAISSNGRSASSHIAGCVSGPIVTSRVSVANPRISIVMLQRPSAMSANRKMPCASVDVVRLLDRLVPP